MKVFWEPICLLLPQRLECIGFEFSSMEQDAVVFVMLCACKVTARAVCAMDALTLHFKETLSSRIKWESGRGMR